MRGTQGTLVTRTAASSWPSIQKYVRLFRQNKMRRPCNFGYPRESDTIFALSALHQSSISRWNASTGKAKKFLINFNLKQICKHLVLGSFNWKTKWRRTKRCYYALPSVDASSYGFTFQLNCRISIFRRLSFLVVLMVKVINLNTSAYSLSLGWRNQPGYGSAERTQRSQCPRLSGF